MSEKVTNFPGQQFRTLPDMVIRWLQANSSEVEAIVVSVKMKGNSLPMVMRSSSVSPYFMALSATILQDFTLDMLEPAEDTNEKAPGKGA